MAITEKRSEGHLKISVPGENPEASNLGCASDEKNLVANGPSKPRKSRKVTKEERLAFMERHDHVFRKLA